MRKVFRFILFFIIGVIVIFSAFALLSGKTYLFKAVWYNFADIDDYRIFSNDTVTAGSAQPWQLAADYNQQEPPASLLSLLDDLKTVALVKIRDGEIVYERYWDGYSDSSLSNSFSMAKSITGLLVGVAIREGKISSVEEKVSRYLPGFAEGLASSLTIRDLLTMSSGSDWDESYANPLSITTEAYYGSNITKTAASVSIVDTPGTLHRYKSGDTQLLAMVLEKATGRSLSDYASEKIWQPLGAVHPALWSTDRKGGVEKAYCCFNSNARDFAKIGQLMLDSGRWNGQPVIDSAYFAESVSPCQIPDGSGFTCNYYGYQWWLYPAERGVFYARGILGQYIIINPAARTVVVRLGHKRSGQRVNGAPGEVAALVEWGEK